MRCIVVAEDIEVSHGDAGRVPQHDDHGLLAILVGIARIGLAHEDDHCAAPDPTICGR
jgi:hypothetical protein